MGAAALQDKIEKKLGRRVEVAPLVDGKYAVEYFNFNTPPPPKGDTIEEALELFLSYLDTITPAGEENTDA